MQKLIFFCLFMIPLFTSAQHQQIKDFLVKENLSQNGKLAIIAVDSTEKVDNVIHGNFRFIINGFQQDLQFEDGVSVYNHSVESSTFVLLKHKNQDKEIARYYFVRKTDKGLTPYKISALALILIPAVILLIAYMFKRFLTTIVVLVIVYGYFHYSKGLNISQLLESLFIGFKNFF
ncbi:hypothetical protein [Sphingobacterium hungaricum]|uniref:Uncharacterized protein n=1 Tax=Sphingobacterium hungaricum TaxID=2082723 RepID=A0A928UX96_9SPHI|nr:hypothetical protein [Sphingobacterium hungaricum]MBE8714698.1 hypothetical protein [Sphingobacterium hungaricum]